MISSLLNVYVSMVYVNRDSDIHFLREDDQCVTLDLIGIGIYE